MTSIVLNQLPIRRGQFLQACRDAGITGLTVEAISEAVDAARDVNVSLAFNHSPFVPQGGVLATFLAGAPFNLGPGQLAAIFAAAVAKPD